MKKYLQITVVLGLFFSFVIFKNFYKGDEGENIQIGANNNVQIENQIPNQSNSSVNSSSPTLTPSANSNSNTSSSTSTASVSNGKFKNGTYTGSSEDAFYGYIQVKVAINDGKISDVIFLDHPQDNRTSSYINDQAMPMLKAEAISAQSANINRISGASYSSMAFQKSLENALNQAI